MKNALKDKFKNNFLVRPLYKRLKKSNKTMPTIHISVDKTELDGRDTKVKSDNIRYSSEVFKSKHTHTARSKKTFVCEKLNKRNIFVKLRKGDTIKYGLKESEMFNTAAIRDFNDKVDAEHKANKIIQAGGNNNILPKVPCTWLRVYPLPQSPGESIGSVILRCTFCQFGLATFLVMWTSIWIFVIHYFEGPFEIKMYRDFEKQQIQLVIDLATELRQVKFKTNGLSRNKSAISENHAKFQISPLSYRWKAAIEKRIEEASLMTSVALLKGARLKPGQYWNLSGTFLFTIYVMTALGFGAPVPRTTEGKTAVVIYSALSIPIHFYLMMNVSMCIVVHAQAYMKQLRSTVRHKKPFIVEETALDNDSPNCSRHSEVLKAPSRCCLSGKIMRCLSMLRACHSVPLAAFLYYSIGVCIFGILHDLEPLKALMFPIEFTTSGGLDHIPGHFRILYGFYVEGAMILIACALATFRRYSSPGILWASKKYRLFAIED